MPAAERAMADRGVSALNRAVAIQDLPGWQSSPLLRLQHLAARRQALAAVLFLFDHSDDVAERAAAARYRKENPR